MIHRLYSKMTLYLLGLVLTSLILFTLLFLATLGWSYARDIHQMMRNHTRYLETRIGAMVEEGAPVAAQQEAIDDFARHFAMGIALIDSERRVYAASALHLDGAVRLTRDMFDQVQAKGAFVQSSHFVRPLIYLVPLKASGKGGAYLYLTKTFRSASGAAHFWLGLFVLGTLLSAAIYPLAKSITRPITALSSGIKEMAAGNFSPEVHCGRKDEIGELFASFRDMSASVNQMIQSKKQLLADISHELRSPLARIRVGTEILKETSRSGKARGLIRGIENEIAFMDRLLDTLFSYAKMNLPGFTLRLDPVDAGDLMAHLFHQYLPLAETKGLRLVLAQPAQPVSFPGDLDRLQQVLGNLLDNAIRYSPPGGTITLGARREGGRMAFWVADQGGGVPEDQQEKIFEPLCRMDPSRSPDAGHAGLGLAIAKTIVELHGGRIGCRRKQDETVFRFSLPV